MRLCGDPEFGVNTLGMLQSLRSLLYALWGLVVYTNPTGSAQAELWRGDDLARLEGAPEIDPRCVGRMLGVGLQHRIYEYEADGERMVLKVSTRVPFLRFPSAQEAQEDVDYVTRYFAPFAIEPTRVVRLDDGSYAILQRRLERFHAITSADLANDRGLKQQFLEVARRNREMMQAAGRSLDFLGREGQRRCRAALVGLERTPTISNLAIETLPDGSAQLRIMDTDLENFRPGAAALRDRQSALAAQIAVAENRWLIRHFFGIDIANPESN